MKVMKKIIIIKLILLSFIMTGCPQPSKTWMVEIVNELQYSIYAIVEFKDYDKTKCNSGIIPHEGIAITYARLDENRNAKPYSKKANNGIRKISIFREDETPLMVLQGKKMNEYVIFRDNNTIEDVLNDREYWHRFRLEIKEEYINIGLKKVLDFGKEIEELEDNIEEDTEYIYENEE